MARARKRKVAKPARKPPIVPSAGKAAARVGPGSSKARLAEVAGGAADPEWVDAGKDMAKAGLPDLHVMAEDQGTPPTLAEVVGGVADPEWAKAGRDMNKVFQPAGKDLANPADSVVRTDGKRIGRVGREIAAPTMEQTRRDAEEFRRHIRQLRAREAVEALGSDAQRLTAERVRRSGPTLQDDLARYNGRVWDSVEERWIDHRAIAPTPACVHFNIDNVFAQLEDDYEALNESGREIFARHGVPFWMAEEGFVGFDPEAWSRAFFTTLREQYPRPSAPYGECWLESGHPGRMGCHLTVTTSPAPHLFLTTMSDLAETSTYVNGLIYLDDAKTGFPTFMALFVIRLDVNGEIAGVDWETCYPHELGEGGNGSGTNSDGGTAAARAFTVVVLRAVLLTFSLCNARNIRQQVVREAKPASKKQRNAKPLVEVREIRIDGTMTPSSNEPPKTHRGPVRAHKVRAHWRRYGPKYGTGLLFGRYEALIFQPAGRRGLEALGVVDQRYRVIPRKTKDQQ